jgi:hypothetical protein
MTGIYPFNPDKVLATIVRSKSLSPIDSISVKISSSMRLLRRIYNRLRKTGKIIKETAILLHAGEKLATEFEIV